MSAQVVTLAAYRRQRMQDATERDSAEKLAVITRRDLTAEGVMALASIAPGDLVCWPCSDLRCPKHRHTGTVVRIFPGGMVKVESAELREFYTLPLGLLTVLKKGGGDGAPSDTEPA